MNDDICDPRNSGKSENAIPSEPLQVARPAVKQPVKLQLPDWTPLGGMRDSFPLHIKQDRNW